jgi:YidC/Oxa1 family membrane protein insertase
MADLPKLPKPPGQSGKKELTMETRLLLAFLLMGLVLFLTPYFYKAPPPPPKQPAPAAANKTGQPAKNAPAAPQPATAAASETLPQVQAGSEEEFAIDTDIYRVRFSNRGAVVRSWVLKKSVDRAGKPLELVDQTALGKAPAPFSLALKDSQVAGALNSGLYMAKPDPDGLGIQYEFSDGKNSAKKSFKFSKNGYLSQVVTVVTQNGAPVEHEIQWRGGFGDATVVNRANDQHSVYFDLSAPKTFLGIEIGQGKLLTRDARSVKDGPVTSTGDYSFAGLDDRFFAFVVLPNDNTSTKVEAVKDDIPQPNGKSEAHVGVEVSAGAVNRMRVFVGPKDIDLLRKVDPKLEQLIDWGWFGVIAKPIFLALHWLNDNVFHNYGWSIVGITIIINLLLFPLRLSSLKGQRKMQKLQPQIAAINAKYKGIGLRDPRKQQQNQEMMELYKKEGYNPAGGCLPMLVQFPILYAFYKVLAVTIELRGAHWLWVTDLSQPEQLPLHVLPLIMIVTQFIMQKMTPMAPGMDPQQAKMMSFMPLMFGFFFYNLSSGLVLYWLTGNLVGIVQQWLINRTMPAPVPAPVAKAPVKKKT